MFLNFARFCTDYWNKKARKTKKNYTAEGFLSKWWVKKGSKKIVKEKYEIRKDGKIKEVKTKMHGNENYKLYYDTYGRLREVYEYKKIKGKEKRRIISQLEYDSINRLIESKSISYKKRKIIGVKGWQILHGGDEILRRIEYFENGLIKTEEEYINGKLNAVKKYKYEP